MNLYTGVAVMLDINQESNPTQRGGWIPGVSPGVTAWLSQSQSSPWYDSIHSRLNLG